MKDNISQYIYYLMKYFYPELSQIFLKNQKIHIKKNGQMHSFILLYIGVHRSVISDSLWPYGL